jgi:hypothetical protein
MSRMLAIGVAAKALSNRNPGRRRFLQLNRQPNRSRSGRARTRREASRAR